MNFNFIQDPRWNQLDVNQKSLMLNEAFNRQHGSQTQGFTEEEDLAARTLFMKKAADVENVIYGQPGRTVGGTIGDIGTSLLQGVVGTGRTVVGLVNIPTGGRFGKWVEEDLGLDLKQVSQDVASLYSDAQKYAQAKVEEAEGFGGTVKTMLQYPSTIGTSVGQSAVPMVAGGLVGRGLLAGASRFAPGLAARPAATYLAAGGGEGTVAGGALSENIRSQTEDGLMTPKQTALAVLGGGGVGAISGGGGLLAQKAGFLDPDVLATKLFIPKASRAPVAAGTKKAPGIVGRVGGGMLGEGFQELPQEMHEQAMENIALGRPAMEGTGKAGAQGFLAGALMGGAVNVINRKHHEDIGKADSVDKALESFTKAVNPIQSESTGFGEYLDQNEDVIVDEVQGEQWEQEILAQRERYRQQMEMLKRGPVQPEAEGFDDVTAQRESIRRQEQNIGQMSGEADEFGLFLDETQPVKASQRERQAQIEGIFSEPIPANEGQAKVDREIAEFKRIRKQEAEVEYLKQAMINKEVPQAERQAVTDRINQLEQNFEERKNRTRAGEIPILEAGQAEDPRIIKPKQERTWLEIRQAELVDRLGGKEDLLGKNYAPPVKEGEYGKKLTERYSATTAIVDDQSLLDTMQSQVNDSSTKGYNYDEDGNKFWYSASSPEWMKNLNAAAKKSGLKGLSRAEINTVIDKARNGQPLTERQQSHYDLLLQAAEEVKQTDPSYAMAYEAEEMEADGFVPMGGQNIPAADLEMGSSFIGTVDGKKDTWHVKGEKDGNIVLQDGVRKEVDMFDRVNVDGIKAPSEPLKKGDAVSWTGKKGNEQVGDLVVKAGESWMIKKADGTTGRQTEEALSRTQGPTEVENDKTDAKAILPIGEVGNTTNDLRVKDEAQKQTETTLQEPAVPDASISLGGAARDGVGLDKPRESADTTDVGAVATKQTKDGGVHENQLDLFSEKPRPGQQLELFPVQDLRRDKPSKKTGQDRKATRTDKQSSQVGKLRAISLVGVETTGTIQHDGLIVHSEEDAASLLSHLTKSPQEQIYTVTVDKDGLVIEVHRYSKGAISSLIARPVEMAGRILKHKNASKVYFVHNHPSGDTASSRADGQVHQRLSEALGLKDIGVVGLVLGRDEKGAGTWRSFDRYGDIGTVKPISATIKKTSLPIKERVFIDTSVGSKPISNNAALETYLSDKPSGFLFLNSKNHPTGYLDFQSGLPAKSHSAILLDAAESTNATSAIFYNADGHVPGRQDFFEELSAWAMDNDLHVHNIATFTDGVFQHNPVIKPNADYSKISSSEPQYSTTSVKQVADGGVMSIEDIDSSIYKKTNKLKKWLGDNVERWTWKTPYQSGDPLWFIDTIEEIPHKKQSDYLRFATEIVELKSQKKDRLKEFVSKKTLSDFSIKDLAEVISYGDMQIATGWREVKKNTPKDKDPVGPKRIYFRLGKPPESGRSLNRSTGEYEKGVSVYVTPQAGSIAGFVERPVYYGEGEQIGIGGDDEPVIRVTGEWAKLSPEKSSTPTKGVQHSTTTSTDKPAVTLSQIKKWFKGQSVGINSDGSIWVRLQNGAGLIIRNVKQVAEGKYLLSTESGKMDQNGVIAGKYFNNEIELVDGVADGKTFTHELEHFLEDIGVITKMDQLAMDIRIRKMIREGNLPFKEKQDQRENRADFMAHYLSDREEFRGTTIGKIVQKVSDFLDAMLNLGRASVRKVARGIESGKIFSRPTNGVESPNSLYETRVKPAPKKTIKAYKLFKVKATHPGQLFPLFVGANESVPVGIWQDAETGPMTDKGKVKSKLGPLAFRPGWHAGDMPIATHIGESGDGSSKPQFRPADQVWAEVEVAADVDWQTEANKRAQTTKAGKPIARTAHITDQIPVDGYYRYKTNPNMTGNWIITGAMKINRILSDKEVSEINKKHGIADLPRVNGNKFDAKKYGFETQYSTTLNTDTKAFRDWFGDSKVVDKDGKPLVVYHGTRASEPISVFSTTKGVSNWGKNQGAFFFSDNPNMSPDAAAKYVGLVDEKGEPTSKTIEQGASFGVSDIGGSYYPVYLRLENPMPMKDSEWVGDIKKENKLIKEAKSKGHDGLIAIVFDSVKGWEKVYIVFEPTQIKSIYNRGTWSQTDPRIQYSTQEAFHVDNDAGMVDNFKHHIVDELSFISKVYKAIGKEFSEETDFLLKERLRVSKAKSDIDKSEAKYFKPIKKIIGESGLTVEKVDEFLYARHAPEANARLRMTNARHYLNKLAKAQKGGKLEKSISAMDKEFDDMNAPTYEVQSAYQKLLESELAKATTEKELGVAKDWETFSAKPSGMTDVEATKLNNKWKSNNAMKAIAKIFDTMNNDSLDISLAAGRMTKEEHAAIKGTFKYYAPLHREGHETKRAFSGIGQGLTNLGRDTQVRGGSTKRAVHLLANAMVNHEKAIVNSKKAEVTKAFVEFVKANPNEDFWSFEKSKTRPVYDGAGNIRRQPARTVEAWEAEVKVGGQMYIISVNRHNDYAMRILEIIKGGQHTSGPIVGALMRFNRILSAVNTTFNPEFIISNFARDFQTAAYNLSDTEVKSMTGQVLKNVGKAMKGLHSFTRGDSSHEWAKVAKQFEESGAKIGWIDYGKDVESRTKKLESQIDLFREGHISKKSINKLFNTIEDYNSIVENGVRLASFKAGLDAGMTESKAALMAKNLTVNFNQKGAMGPLINSLYLFANAGIQGSVRIVQALKNSPRARKMVGATIAAASVLAVANRGIGGDDEDGENYYEKVDEHLKARNLILMIPGSKGKYVKIPLPWGYNVFWALGTEIGEAFTSDKYNALEGMNRMINTTLDAFNPLQSATLLQTLSPTILDPIAMVGENKTFYGGPLMPETNIFDKTPMPDSQRFWKSVRPVSKFISQSVNAITGGDKVVPGLIDVSPETLDLVFDTFTGGAGRFVADTLFLPVSAVTGDLTLSKTPMLRKVLGTESEYQVANDYRKHTTYIYRLKERMEVYPEKAQKYRKDPAFKLYYAAKSFDKQIGNLRKSLKVTKNEGTEKLLEKRINKLQKTFNRRFIEAGV